MLDAMIKKQDIDDFKNFYGQFWGVKNIKDESARKQLGVMIRMRDYLKHQCMCHTFEIKERLR